MKVAVPCPALPVVSPAPRIPAGTGAGGRSGPLGRLSPARGEATLETSKKKRITCSPGLFPALILIPGRSKSYKVQTTTHGYL